MIEPMEADLISAERAMLVRFCARYTGASDVAEDLAQQALLEAWRNKLQLRDPRARQSWLFSIARNVCLEWGRSRSREVWHRADGGDAWDPADRLADDVDLELELERDELAQLLDRALALLPPDTREALIRRYVDQCPQAEVAECLGLTEGAVEARLHRGKLALRRLLSTELSDAAVSHGLILPGNAGWQETRLWCPGCGQRRLEGRLDSEGGELDLRCSDCALPYNYYMHAHMGEGLRHLKTFKPAVSRVLQAIDDTYRLSPVDGAVPCSGCGELVPIRSGTAAEVPETWRHPDSVYLLCPRCRALDHETWHSLTWSLPAAQRFWRDHPRMRFLPERGIEVGGLPAVVTGFVSLTDAARLEVVALRESLCVVSIDGQPMPRGGFE